MDEPMNFVPSKNDTLIAEPLVPELCQWSFSLEKVEIDFAPLDHLW
jgi:hypothetical protein